ncbi:AAA family ATPase [uncultured Roseibium sp.]|uniref:AAA family ATPase n=1 Tax=uncultured Roseibium sp. TaxID=1936171 RepID=UPI003217BB96
MAETFTLRSLPGLFAAGFLVPRYTIEGVLPARGVSLLYGPSGAGKTGLAIATALAVASGDDWAGRETEFGGVLYIAAEDASGVRARMHVAAKLRGQHDLPVVVAGQLDASLSGQRGAAEIAEIVEAHADDLADLSLIVIDTVSCVFGDASQDDAHVVSRFMNGMHALAAAHNAAVLLVHHTGKSGTQLRGSQVFEDRADAILQVTKSAGGPVVKITKQRNGRDGAAFAYRIEGVDFEFGCDVFNVQTVDNLREITVEECVDDVEKHPARTTDRDVLLAVLEKVTSVEKAVTKNELKIAVFAEWPDKSESARRKAFYEGLNSLKKEGKVSERGKKVTLKVTGDKKGDFTAKSHQSPVTPPPLKGEGGDEGDSIGDLLVIDPPKPRAAK